jgi:uncharacterized protein (TIGR03067 family)
MLGTALAQEPAKLDEAAKKDQEALQGPWELEQLEVSGKKSTAEELKKAGARVVIAGTSITFKSDSAKEGAKGTFTLDAGKMPRWIDLEDGKKNKELGIYEIQGDSLKICLARPSNERPKEFAAKAMTDSTLMTFKREKK